MKRHDFIVTGILILLLAGMGTADYFIKERRAMHVPETDDPAIQETTGSQPSSIEPVHKGVSRSAGPDVQKLLMERGFTWTDFTGQSVIALTTGDDITQKLTILKNNDRAAGFAWIDSSDVKDIFRAIKEALQENFSGNVTDLVDETQRPADAAPRDILSFRDPAISSERIVFVRIRSRLYEFHIAEGLDQDIAMLIDELGK